MMNKTMSKEEALQIAYDTLSEIVESNPTYLFGEEEYYKNLKKAAKKLKEMMKSQ